MVDSYKHKGRRAFLVEVLKEKGIEDPKVLEAISKVPRHFFLPSAFDDFAYKDEAFPIAANQTISQPFTVAFQSSLLEAKPGEAVLEIGTGSGYQSCVLIEMGVNLYTIERQKDLFDFSKQIFKKLRLTPKHQSFGDGYKGLPLFAPFDKILVTAASATMPKELLKQLKIGGIMVLPLGEEEQMMTKIIRKSEKEFVKQELGDCKFVPMLRDREDGQN
ncbi:MAG: protein-L-isoaspartate O-methyltransferase [Flavobacteriaceae bacterium]|nr:MAG: protein-L-isoaspartate O-methyltransferase [Flavobacteriaceae bacterium]